MIKVAKFEKVSFEQFNEDFKKCFPEIEETAYGDKVIFAIYENIRLPKRGTSGSAGYDFYAPIDINLAPGQSIKIPTGIRCKIAEGWVLQCFPRSSLGFKYRFQLDNTVGIIDSDYYYADNQGDIFAKITNDTKSDKSIEIDGGEAFMQGVFTQFGITYDDNATEKRVGGIGSTNTKNS